MIGKRALDDPRNSLVHHFVRLVVELKASYFVFENVRGLTIGAHRKFLEEIIGEFRKNGYRVVEDYQVLNAAHHGVPQNRQRLFLMGARKGFPLPEYPDATHEVNGGTGSWKSVSAIDADRMGRAARHSRSRRLRGTAAPGLGQGAVQEIDRLQRSVAGRRGPIRRITPPREFDATLLTSSMRTVHTDLSKKRFLETQPGDTEPVSRFHKLDPEGVCNTIRAGTASDHGAFTSPRPIHPYFAALHHRARSGAPALLSGLVPLSRDKMARIPADRQLRAAAARQSRGIEGPRSVPGSQEVRSVRRTRRFPPAVVRHVRRRRALRRAADVVPKRIRMGQGGEANG